MATVVAATVTTPLMIRRREDHQAVVEIEVAGHDLWPGNPTFLGAMKFHDTITTDAGAIARFGRDTRQQFIGNANRHTPARTFVGCGITHLAII